MTEPVRPPDQQLTPATYGREGMVTVWDHNGEYVGCIGAESWGKVVAIGDVFALSRRVEKQAEMLEACAKLSHDRQQLFQAAERRVEELEARLFDARDGAAQSLGHLHAMRDMERVERDEIKEQLVAAEREVNTLKDDLEAVKRMYPRVRDFLDARASVSARPKEDTPDE